MVFTGAEDGAFTGDRVLVLHNEGGLRFTGWCCGRLHKRGEMCFDRWSNGKTH